MPPNGPIPRVPDFVVIRGPPNTPIQSNSYHFILYNSFQWPALLFSYCIFIFLPLQNPELKKSRTYVIITGDMAMFYLNLCVWGNAACGGSFDEESFMDSEGHRDGRASVQLVCSGRNFWWFFLLVAKNSGGHPLVSGFEACWAPQACTSTSGFEAGILWRWTRLASARCMQLVLTKRGRGWFCSPLGFWMVFKVFTVQFWLTSYLMSYRIRKSQNGL